MNLPSRGKPFHPDVGKRQSYLSDHWKQFRSEIIELDGGHCRRCGRGIEDGAVLQVHHLRYREDRQPWDYPLSDCETLCKGCHAAEHGHIRPKVGWEYVDQDDLGELCGECQDCGTEIRYVFMIQHPHWEPMEVGTFCCDNLTGTQLASNHMESLRRFESRRARFIRSSRWKDYGNAAFIRQSKIDLQILGAQSGFQILMNGLRGRKVFPSIHEAKKAAFEVIEDGSAQNYLRRHFADMRL